MMRVGKDFSGVETPLFASRMVQPQPHAKEEVEIPIAPAPPSIEKCSFTTCPSGSYTYTSCYTYTDQHSTPHALPPQEQPTTPHESSMPLLTTLMETSKEESKETRKEKEIKVFKGRLNQEEVNAASKRVSAVSAPELVSADEPTVFDDEDVTMTMARTLIKLKAKKAKLLNEQIAQKLHDEEVQKAATRDKQEKDDMERALPDKDVEEPKKKRVADETLLQESFKKLRAAEVSRSEQIPSNDPKEMTEEDVHNMLEIVPVPEFKVEALQVKYPIINWEIHSECSKVYWKIIRVRGITEAYQVFEYMLKGFDREDLVALWNLVKEKFSSAMPSEDKEKALWVDLKRLFELDTDDVLWKLQRYMHAPLTWKLYINCGVHHVSSTRGHDIFMLIEKDYPLSNDVMILMLSGKLQVEEDNEMARDLVMKIFMEANKPKSKSLDNEDPHGGQQTKEQKFGYILLVIKMLKLKKLEV
nr:hypothetical protein [Tanacetum cinerariifolium]